MHNDLDDALAKLQQILATNFMLDGNTLTNCNKKNTCLVYFSFYRIVRKY